jgi:hypothetical protein
MLQFWRTDHLAKLHAWGSHLCQVVVWLESLLELIWHEPASVHWYMVSDCQYCMLRLCGCVSEVQGRECLGVEVFVLVYLYPMNTLCRYIFIYLFVEECYSFEMFLQLLTHGCGFIFLWWYPAYEVCIFVTMDCYSVVMYVFIVASTVINIYMTVLS